MGHDVIIIIGLFALFQWEFDLTVMAALLAVIGYSLNDTIVVSDHIRENFRVLRKGDSAEIINYSINQTLGRTIMTSLTTALVLLALIGVGVGTYSSIFVASSILMTMNKKK